MHRSPLGTGVRENPHQPIPRDRIKVFPDVRIHNPVDLLPHDPVGQSVQRIMRAAPRSEPVAETKKLHLVYRCQDHIHHRPLDDFIPQCSDAKRSCSTVRLGYGDPPNRQRPGTPPPVRDGAGRATALPAPPHTLSTSSHPPRWPHPAAGRDIRPSELPA